MAKIKSTKRAEASSASETSSVRPTRFDPAHKIPRAEENARVEEVEEQASEPALASADAALELESFAAEVSPLLSELESEAIDGLLPEELGQFSAAIVQQFRTQAQQLAAHLELRQRELDRREAEFHAQLARHDTEARNARLWFQEHHHELMERQASLGEQEKQAAAELAELELQSATERAQLQGGILLPMDVVNKLNARHGELSNQDLELLRKLAKDHELATELALRQRQCETSERLLEDRQRLLEVAELSLARGQADLEDGWQKLQAERKTLATQAEEQRHRLADQRRRAEAELSGQREKLSHRANHLETRTAALEQMRSELMHLQRETLEMRLATEEIWSQLSGAAPPAVLTQSVARIRAKLAEHFRSQTNEIAAQRQALETLAAKVTQQHEQMAAQKRELDHWNSHQQNGIESQAARLVAREQELDKEHRRMQQVQLQWDADRRELEREIRRLQGELRHLEPSQLMSA